MPPKQDDRTEKLEAAFAEDGPATIGNLALRPFSLGTLNLCRRLNLTMFLEGGEEPDDAAKQHQIVAFAWMQSAPLDEVLAALREGNAEDKIAAFEFTLGLDALPALIREIGRISELAGAAAVEVEPKPGQSNEKDAPPNC